MQTRTQITAIFNCSLERAFKTPMLCDVSKVHTGFGIMPKVTHCTEDENWGQPGGSKKVFVAKSPTYKGCLLYTSPSPRDRTRSRMPSSA